MHDSTRKTNFHKLSDKVIRSEVPAELKPIFKEAFGNVDYAFSKPHDEREVILATAADHRASGDPETPNVPFGYPWLEDLRDALPIPTAPATQTAPAS